MWIFADVLKCPFTYLPKVLTGQIDAEILVNLSAEELASDDRRQENDKIRVHLTSEAVRGLKNQASTDMFKVGDRSDQTFSSSRISPWFVSSPLNFFLLCLSLPQCGKCKQRKCTYYVSQGKARGLLLMRS